MSLVEYPNCPFCKSDSTCSRHKEKGINTEKKIYAIPKVSEKKKAQLKDQKPERNKVGKFFAEMITNAPKNCTECGKSLKATMLINPSACVAHILPKRSFKSVATNKDNIIYLCIDCHHTLDNFSPVKMKIYPELKGRVRLLMPLLTQSEISKIPENLL